MFLRSFLQRCELYSFFWGLSLCDLASNATIIFYQVCVWVGGGLSINPSTAFDSNVSKSWVGPEVCGITFFKPSPIHLKPLRKAEKNRNTDISKANRYCSNTDRKVCVHVWPYVSLKLAITDFCQMVQQKQAEHVHITFYICMANICIYTFSLHRATLAFIWRHVSALLSVSTNCCTMFTS